VVRRIFDTLDTISLRGINVCEVPLKEYRAEPSQRKRPGRLIFYDSAGQNGGVAARAFDHVSLLVHRAHEVVESCSCDEGCVRCTTSTWCKEGGAVTSKIGGLLVLKSLLGLHIDLESIPDPPIANDPLMETIVEATQVRRIDGIEVESSK